MKTETNVLRAKEKSNAMFIPCDIGYATSVYFISTETGMLSLILFNKDLIH